MSVSAPQLPSTYWSTIWRRFFGLNISHIDPLLYVGGEFQAQQWPALHRLGIRAVLSLQAERADMFDGVPPDRALRLQVTDFYPPSLEQLQEGVDFIAGTHAANLPVLVHCRAGVGRAPTTAAAYLIAHRGMSATAAVAYIAATRPIIGLNHRQLARLREWEAHVRNTTDRKTDQ